MHAAASGGNRAAEIITAPVAIVSRFRVTIVHSRAASAAEWSPQNANSSTSSRLLLHARATIVSTNGEKILEILRGEKKISFEIRICTIAYNYSNDLKSLKNKRSHPEKVIFIDRKYFTR